MTWTTFDGCDTAGAWNLMLRITMDFRSLMEQTFDSALGFGFNLCPNSEQTITFRTRAVTGFQTSNLTAKASFLHRSKIPSHSPITPACIHDTQYHGLLKYKLVAVAHSQWYHRSQSSCSTSWLPSYSNHHIFVITHYIHLPHLTL
jgi:hypothetical protein